MIILTRSIQKGVVKMMCKKRVGETAEELFQASRDVVDCVVIRIHKHTPGVLIEGHLKTAYLTLLSTLPIEALNSQTWSSTRSGS